MPDLALPRQLHAIGQRAIAEARSRRASWVGAEHVLLAISADRDTPVSSALTAAGLDYATLAGALADERIRSLAVAEVQPVDAAVLTAAPRAGKLGLGASVRDLLRAADKPAAKNGRPGAIEVELVIGILRAELGTVPRMLAMAGVSPASLVARLRSI